MQRLGWTILATALAVSGWAKPSPSNKAAIKAQTSGVDAVMSPAARAAWRAGLQAGRKAHLAKDFAAAVAAFSRALEAFPDDPRALMERGWAKFQAGDLVGAAADTEGALKRSSDPLLRAAALYNLGRVHEARGEVAAAIQVWKESLVLRPNKVVSERLAKLAGQQPTGPLEATRLLGPFADEAAMCSALRSDAHLGLGLRCKRGPVDTPLSAAAAGQAYIAVGSIPTFDDEVKPPPGPAWVDDVDVSGEVVYHLVVVTLAGLFVQPGIAGTYNPGAFGISEEVTFKTAKSVAIPGASVAWLLELGVSRSDSDMGLNEVEFWDSESVAVCGIGPSGLPSCVGPIQTRLERSRELLHEDEPTPPGEAPMEHDLWKKSAVMGTRLVEGVLTLEVLQGKDMEAGLKALAGKHPVVLL